MHRSFHRWTAWLMCIVGISAWAGFGVLIWLLNSERATYASLVEERAIEKVREESQTRLRSLVRETVQEREALEAAVRLPIVGAVETIEMTGRAAGVKSITIVEASPQTMNNKELSAVGVTVEAEGTFASLGKAVAMFEAMPLATTVESVQMEKIKDVWKLSVRLRVLLASSTL